MSNNPRKQQNRSQKRHNDLGEPTGIISDLKKSIKNQPKITKDEWFNKIILRYQKTELQLDQLKNNIQVYHIRKQRLEKNAAQMQTRPKKVIKHVGFADDAEQENDDESIGDD